MHGLSTKSILYDIYGHFYKKRPIPELPLSRAHTLLEVWGHSEHPMQQDGSSWICIHLNTQICSRQYQLINKSSFCTLYILQICSIRAHNTITTNIICTDYNYNLYITFVHVLTYRHIFRPRKRLTTKESLTEYLRNELSSSKQTLAEIPFIWLVKKVPIPCTPMLRNTKSEHQNPEAHVYSYTMQVSQKDNFDSWQNVVI